MASGRDVRDMLGLPVSGGGGAGADAKSAVQKRAKVGTGARKIQGVAREVAALYGERPPPVAVYEEKKSYRAKRQSTGPAKKWVQQPFTNPARGDSLVLKHWRRKPTVAPPVTADGGEDTTMLEGDNAESYIELCGDYAKYNIAVDLPTFTDEEYDAHLRSDDWSREETDYLFEVVRDYSYRWAVIWDRYDYQPASKSHLTQETLEASQALAALPFAPPKTRTVEDLKARFYEISAKLMKLRIPEVQMDADQYSTYEMLSKYDPTLERHRKLLASALMNRNMDEVKEEEFLLTELQRINMAANRLDAEREELRARLEAPIPNQQVSAGLASFTSSQALQALFSQLFQQDRSKKRASGGGTGPGRLSISANELINTPTSAQAQLNAANRRQSMAQQPAAQTPIRTLSPQQEYRFNVSTHDRLTSGVTFGADKLLKMRQAKSNVQTQKIAAALAELGIADVISIPTSKVGEAFEQLVSKVGKLLDVRKVREKEEGECRVLEAMKEKRQGESSQANGTESGSGDADGETASATPATKQEEIPDSQETPDVDIVGDNDDDGDEDADGEADEDAEGEVDDDEDAEGESEAVSTRATSTAGHKRSASVLSQASTKDSKRVRK